jgi:HSP20 family protein
MANLLRRNANDERSLAHRDETISPYRMLREMMRWDPLRAMMPSVFGAESAMFEPAFEIAEHKDRFVFSADMPGVKEKDIDVKLTGNRLTISGKRESEHEDKGDTFYACERSYGSFTRSFTLPAEAFELDKVSADLKDDVLTIQIPKKETVQSKQIEVKATEKGKA